MTASCTAPSLDRARAVDRVALLSVHTSPLDQPGTGDGGGLNVYVLQIARRLAARGVHVDVFTRAADPSSPPTVSVADRVLVHHIVAGPVAPIPKAEVADHLSAFALGMMRHPTAGSHDVVHGQYWLSGWVGHRLARRWDVPFVQTFHTLGMLKNATLAPGDVPESPLRLAVERRVAHAADRVLGLTCGEGRLLYRAFGLSGRDISIVPAGVDLDVFAPRRTGDRPGRTRPPQLLFVGRLQPLKGPDVAIRTLALVRERYPQARLRIVGGPSGSGVGRAEPSQLRRLAEDCGVGDAVDLLPARPQRDLAALYCASDVVLVPSRSETFGLVALEAQACGTPVVAAAVGGLRAVVGDGGTLVAGHDPADHAAAVLAYLDDPALRAAATEAGPLTAARASWDRTVDRLLEVYADVVAERRPARHAS